MSLLASMLALTVGFNTIIPGQAVNKDTNPIVVSADPSEITNTMILSQSSLTATLGFDANGGGYWNSLLFDGYSSLNNINLIQWDFGRGGQLAEVDRAHNVNDYNPTQAGETDTLGVPITMTATTHKLCANQFNVPLWKKAGATFTTVRSEQDMSVCYIDRSSYFGVPALQVDFLIGYVSQPNAIHQFDSTYDNQWATVAINGTRTGTANDLSREKLIWSFRLTSSSFPYVMWKSSGVWQNHLLDNTNFECQTGTNGSYHFVRGTSLIETLVGSCTLPVDNDVQFLTTGTTSSSAIAVGLYWPMTGPDSTNNTSQTYTTLSTTGSGTAHNYHSQSFFRSAVDDPPTNSLVALKFVHSMSGVLKPDDTQYTSGRGFLLFCNTADQCFSAVNTWKAGNYTGDETP